MEESALRYRTPLGGAALACLVAACATPTDRTVADTPDAPVPGAVVDPPVPIFQVQGGLPLYHTTFSDVALGHLPGDWLDLGSARGGPPWLVAGSWSVVAQGGGTHALAQTGTHWPWYGGAPPLSFMRFDAGTFHRAGNSLPDHYRVDVGLRVLACDPRDPYYPIGDTGVQVYFQDTTHYCEMVYRPHTVEMWLCDGGVPYRFTGWKLLGRYAFNSGPGQLLTVRAEIDAGKHTFTASLPGSLGSRTVSAGLIHPGTHWLTLRASNSVVRYDHVSVQSL